MASIHLSIHCPNSLVQESVRAYYRGFYADLVTELPRIEDGYAYPPDAPGTGADLNPDIFERTDLTIEASGGGAP